MDNILQTIENYAQAVKYTYLTPYYFPLVEWLVTTVVLSIAVLGLRHSSFMQITANEKGRGLALKVVQKLVTIQVIIPLLAILAIVLHMHQQAIDDKVSEQCSLNDPSSYADKLISNPSKLSDDLQNSLALLDIYSRCN